MITRIWHGWTTEENAPLYEELLLSEIFIQIKERNIQGFKGIELLKRSLNNETEFMTIMHFTDLGSVIEFAGEDYEKSVVLEKAQKLLRHYDARSQHYEVVADYR